MGGRGARTNAGQSGEQGRGGKAGGMNASDIISERDLVSQREQKTRLVDETLGAFKDAYDEYGYIVEQILTAKLKPKASRSVMAYYDGANIAINERFFNDNLQSTYQQTVDMGFHPSNGTKSAAAALTSHEIGHALTDMAAKNMGITSIDSVNRAATRIVNEARSQTSHRGVVQMARAISEYATYSNAEAVAEAYCDVYCNGGKAKSESKAIVNVLNKYTKNK